MADGISKDIEITLKALKANGFDVEFVETADAATKLVLNMIPAEATVGIAGSTSVRQTGLATLLRERGAKVIDVVAPSELPIDELMRQSVCSDVLLTSSNAVTLDGKLVNIDAAGNRVAGMMFGPKKVILIVGANKIVRNVDEAIDRIRNVIAPYHCMVRGTKTPCAVELRCSDCRSPARICNITTILEKKPWHTEMTIILVREDMGLGWHPDWPEERREKIALIYRETRKGYSPATQSIGTPQKGKS